MKVVVPGHVYVLDHLDGSGKTTLNFVSRPPLHEPAEGVINQEVLRALIDRVQVLDAEVPWPGNAEILKHLRMALALHEARALLRHVEKGEIRPETLLTGPDGHFQFVRAAQAGDTGTAETEGLGAKHEHAVGSADAPSPLPHPQIPITRTERGA